MVSQESEAPQAERRGNMKLHPQLNLSLGLGALLTEMCKTR